MGNVFEFTWEAPLITWLQAYTPSFLLKILDVVTYFGDTYFLVALLAFVYLCYDKKAGRKTLMNALMSLMIACSIKNVFKRLRPYFVHKEIKCLKIVEKEYDMYDALKQGFSFPSMHSSNITTISGSLYVCYKKKILLFISIFLSLIVGVSRVVFGCHYPSDVIVGLLLGAFVVTVFSYLQDKLEDKYFYLIGVLIVVIGSIFCTSQDFYTSIGIYLGFIFCEIVDKKYIHFENTKSISRSIFRLFIALGTFLLVSNGLKLPFSSAVLNADNYLAYLIRTLRYLIATFIGLGLTPCLYKYNFLKK